MLTYLLILFYTLTCYFHREKCFEFEGNVYDLFFICKGIISEMDKKKISHLYLDGVFLLCFIVICLKQFCKVCNNA
jgi:hypothetical protein